MKTTLQKPGQLAIEADLMIACAFRTPNNDKIEKNKNKNKLPFAIDNNLKEIDAQFNGFLIQGAQDEAFKGDEGQIFVTSTLGKSKAKSIALIGLGLSHDQTVDLFRRVGGESYKLAQKKSAHQIAVIFPESISVPPFDVVQAFVEGFHSASYQFDRYLTHDKKANPVKEISLHLPVGPTAELRSAINRGEIISTGVALARDLINDGPSALNPKAFAEHAIKVAEAAHLTIEVLDEKRLKKEKMGMMLAVASASEHFTPPRLIRLHYKPKRPSGEKIVLIGKGVTFDSGGLDLKTAEGMLDMKVDMSGAAAVLAILQIAGKLMPKTEVIGYMACVENGVGPASYHPGDILISRKGASVEVANTDAEGRLLLADTITYAIDTDKPDTIIDVATLTGASMIALGAKTSALFSNDDSLADAIHNSGKAAGEHFWRLPLTKSLKEVIKSPVADIKNCGDRYGGAITAALFLEHFIEEGIKWAHLDIAGPATNSKPHPYLPHGGVGFSIRTLVDYLMSQ